MYSSETYDIYQSLIRKALDETETLPSLPAITLKIRMAISDPDVSAESLANLIARDPALVALLIKYSASPLYQTTTKPTTLQGVIALMGMSAVSSIVMTHSIKSLFVMNNPKLRRLFNESWKRQIGKATMSAFLAKALRYRPADEVLLACLLSEVGSLALIATLNDAPEVPERDVYISLCRDYSKSLSTTLLTKWRVDESIVKTVKSCGNWDEASPGVINMSDIINLALYHSLKQSDEGYDLPPLPSLRAFMKLPEELRTLNESGDQLQVVIDSMDDINQLTMTMT